MFGTNFSQLGAGRLLIVHMSQCPSRSQFQLVATHSVLSLISLLALSLLLSLALPPCWLSDSSGNGIHTFRFISNQRY